MNHFIRKSGSVFLDEELYKAEPSETYKAPPMHIEGMRPTRENIEKYVWDMTKRYKVPQLYNTILNDVKTESGFKQWKPSGKLVTSESGAVGLGQLMPKTASGLGVERKDWRGNLEGMVKLWGNNYRAAKEAGMLESNARRYGSMAYFAGGSGGADPKLNTSHIEKHNQAALSSFRKKTGNPNATLWDMPAKSLKGAPSVVAKYGGPKADWYSGLKAAGKSHPEGAEKPFDLKLLSYSQTVETGRGAKRKPHYIRVGEGRKEAEKHGLSGYVKRDVSGKPVASVPVHQTQARPSDIKPAPRAIAQKPPAPRPAAPMTTADARSSTATSPTQSLVRPAAVGQKPGITRKSLFQSEKFIKV